MSQQQKMKKRGQKQSTPSPSQIYKIKPKPEIQSLNIKFEDIEMNEPKSPDPTRVITETKIRQQGYQATGPQKQSLSAPKVREQNQQNPPTIQKFPKLPIDSYPLNKIHMSSYDLISQQSKKDTVVVVLKHTQKDFAELSFDSYREKSEQPVRKVSELDNLLKRRKDLQNFYRKRYYLFSKYDSGVQIDEEGWYSVTPEVIAKYIAERANEISDSGSVNVLDAFVGVGGNLIQFANTCGYCLGVDLDTAKLQCSYHNAQNVYGLTQKKQFDLYQSDFLKLPSYDDTDFDLDSGRFNTVFLSPPWGGTGYQQLTEYSLEHIFPDFDQVVQKALSYSSNLILFLPRNTSVTDLIARLSKFHLQLMGQQRKMEIVNFPDEAHPFQPAAFGELSIEVEMLMVGQSCKAMVVYTGDLAHIRSKQVSKSFVDRYCTQQYDQQKTHSQAGSKNTGGSSASSAKSGQSSRGQQEYLSQLIQNVAQIGGYKYLAKFLQRTGKSRLSMQKVVAQLQQSFNVHDWYYLRKIHKKENNYFLNKAGKMGSSGGGWLSHHTKSSSSNCAEEEVKFSHLNLQRNNERTNTNNIRKHGRTATDSTSEVSSPKTTGSHRGGFSGMQGGDDPRSTDFPFKMIDEEHLSQEEEPSPTLEIQRHFMNLRPIQEKGGSSGSSDMNSNQAMISDDDVLQCKDQNLDEAWSKVRGTRRKQHIELKDLSEENFLSLIDAKNQDRRFYGWLNFQPLFQGIEPEDPVAVAHRAILDQTEMMQFFVFMEQNFEGVEEDEFMQIDQ